MRKLIWLIVIVLVVIGIYKWTAKNDDTTGTVAESFAATMNPVANSGVTGTATIEEGTGGLVVSIALAGALPEIGNHPAHVHMGTCTAPGNVKFALTDVVDGISRTEVTGMTLQDITDGIANGGLSVNVHMSADDLGNYLACGNIEDAP